MHSLRPSHLRTWLRIPRLPGKTTQAPTPPLFAWSDYIPGASRVLKPRRNNLSAGVCTSTASACSALTGRAASCVCIPASQVVSTISNASTARGRECRAYKARSHAATMECRAYKARSHAATMAEINLFRRLPALLDLPKMPVFTGKIRTVWPRGHTSTIRPKVGPLGDLSPRASLRGEVLGSGWVCVEARRIVPERHLGLWGRARGVQLGRVERQPEVPEHPLDGVTGFERGGDLHAAFAARALEDVGQEDSPNHGRPGKAPPRRLPAGDAAVRTRGYTRNRGDDGRHDSSAGGERRGEDAEVAGQVGPWTGHERDQALDQFMRREKERGRAVAPGTLELEFESAVVEAGEPVD